ncbi:DUF6090 family protein [Maribacter cobaltidurans]|uniref:Uncharacterized protein n=1 Tax=Maribacter cobaltidurans TaxID=1178778 RepID=A0A223VAC0_9FLAO|nr:DUF6090 family protein [Maribacter cobaltidurans]ASV31799.1 hypothetical protein CJ263_17130 [Maribacter cobaltidurans]GGD84702.1 hypothetical protein GCM10011412_23040 [Maribacter cobaltidurans]
MIKFFRKIRQNLLDEGKTLKYFKYAVGEIVLVVIGILIALQINNWNENRKVDGEIVKILTEIRSNLINDSLSIEETYSKRLEDINIQYTVINKLEAGDIPYDSINYHLGRVMLARRIVLVDNGYQLIKKLGIELLQDQELRNKLTSYYTTAVKKINDDTNDDDFEFRTVFLPYARNHFRDYTWGIEAIPTDYEQLKSDLYFLTSLNVNIKNEEGTLLALKEGNQAIQELLPRLDKTLSSYQKGN